MTALASQSLARDIASRLHHRASFVCPQFSDVVGDLRSLLAVDFAQNRDAFAARQVEMLESYGYPSPTVDKPFAYSDGIAIIPIHGMLINRFSGSYSFLTGYNFIRSQMNFALADDDVRLIVYDVNSGGGIASGCSELSQEMFDSRAVKPSLAVVDARCYSAAYFLASSATKMISTPSGGLGSIGCVSMHTDLSGMLAQDGIKITFIQFGEEKVDGNSYEPLSPRAKATIQRDVDYHGGLFVQAVARNRGLAEEDFIATEAACFLPTEALEIGLIDDILTPDMAVSQFYNDCYDDDEGSDTDMTVTKTETAVAAAPAAPVVGLTSADVAAAVSSALAAERTRTSGIRTCEEAQGREKLAAHLADNTDMTVDAAKSILAASAKEAPPVPAKPGIRSPLHSVMNREGGAGIGADTEAGEGGEPGSEVLTPSALADRITGAYMTETGKVIEMKPNRAVA